MQKRLVLFDIDETMITSDGAGRRAISRVLKDRYDIDPASIKLSMSGKTDPQILGEIMREAGFTDQEIEGAVPRLIDEYLVHLETEIQQTKHYIVHDGVPEILAALAATEGAFLGLLTGNVERGARMKLERFQLNHHFPLGAYGSDSASRLDLPHVAKQRADVHFKTSFEPKEIVVIGDSIYDVLCAKHYGAVSLAVNSGRTTREELEAQNPDHLFASLADTQSVLKAIFN
ncbi:MAG: HAD family hydrolase [Candidatus Melainabacteria bacterium]|jgi:phosphoglycolate phosphatase-like HAD superfamily hydrolase|nr:HAD family hydrolase [Candidatus Melainabacteria bacterium]